MKLNTVISLMLIALSIGTSNAFESPAVQDAEEHGGGGHQCGGGGGMPSGPRQPCPGKLIGPRDNREYCLLSGIQGSEKEIRDVCRDLGGRLAPINTIGEFQYLADRVDEVAYVNCWQRDNYGDTCIAFWPGGAITEPPQKCDGPLPGLCEFRFDGDHGHEEVEKRE